MIDRDELEQAIRTHGPSEWTGAERDSYVDEVVGVYAGAEDDLDAAGFAHVVWTMGANYPHLGSCPNRGEGNDAYYENPCRTCEAGLTDIGAAVIGEMK